MQKLKKFQVKNEQKAKKIWDEYSNIKTYYKFPK